MRQIILICAGALVAPLDSSVNVAFPAIAGAFSVAPPDIQWVVLAFVLSQSLMALACGRLGDLYGYRRIFLGGLWACVLGHWAVAQASSFEMLVLLRALQGVAVGMAVACAPSLVARLTSEDDRARSLALYSASVSAGLVLGPALGGFLIEWLGWQGVFLFRVALSAVVIIFSAIWLPQLDCRNETIARETRSAVAWDQLRQSGFIALQASAVMIYLSTFSILFWVPFLLASWSSVAAAMSGLVLAAFPAGAFASGLLIAKGPWSLGPKRSERLIRAGTWIASAGLAATAVMAPFQSLAGLGIALLVCGLGLGAFQAGYVELTMRSLPATNSGIAGSLIAVTRLIGLVLGVPALSITGSAFGITATLGASAAALALWGLLAQRGIGQNG